MRLILAIAVSVLCCACKINKEEEKMTSLIMNLGKPGSEFLQTNGLEEKSHVTMQPAGLNFYKYEWPRHELGDLTVQNTAQNKEVSFKIPLTLSVMGTEDAEHSELGIFKIVVNACLSEGEAISHDDARLQFYKILDRLSSDGWQVSHAYDDPRLRAENAFKYYLIDDSYGLPLDYTPTLQQWMDMELAFWNLYKDGNFLQLTFRRDRKRLNPNEEGAYLVVFSFRTAEHKLKELFEPKERAAWVDLLPEKIREMRMERERKEQLLTEKGFDIDSSYTDPEVEFVVSP